MLMFNSTNGTQFTMPVVPASTSGYGGGFGSGWGDGGFFWILIILILVGGWGYGGRGYGGYGGGTETTSVYEGYVLNNDMSMISRQMSDGFNSQERKLDSISNGICSLGYDQLAQMNGINTNIMTVGNAIQTQLADCCCKTQTNIGDVKYAIGSTGADISRGIERGFSDTNYNMATLSNGITNAMQSAFCQTNFNAQTNTRDIVDAQNAGTQAILARIDAMESSRKDEKIAELTAQLNRADLAASQAAQNTYLINELKPCAKPAYITCSPYQSVYGCNCNTGCGC